MDSVRIGVIGLGSIGSRHAEYLKAIQRGRLAAVCDAQSGRAAEGLRPLWEGKKRKVS